MHKTLPVIFSSYFTKSYDRLAWGYILYALGKMGIGTRFRSFVKMRMGNARARVCVNGKLQKPSTLKKYFRQECSLASLMFARTENGLCWLVKDRMDKGTIQGMCLLRE